MDLGTEWVKRTPSEPVLVTGDVGAWDDLAVARPVVLATDTEFMMWYWGTSDFQSFSWGLATATLKVAVPEVLGIRPGQSFPNPFHLGTTIQYSLAAPAQVVLEVYDVAGHHVRQLIDGRMMKAGLHEVPWDGRDSHGRQVPNGVYFYRLSGQGRTSLGKVTRLR